MNLHITETRTLEPASFIQLHYTITSPFPPIYHLYMLQNLSPELGLFRYRNTFTGLKVNDIKLCHKSCTLQGCYRSWASAKVQNNSSWYLNFWIQGCLQQAWNWTEHGIRWTHLHSQEKCLDLGNEIPDHQIHTKHSLSWLSFLLEKSCILGLPSFCELHVHKTNPRNIIFIK